MAGTRILSIIGRKNAGKTTFAVALTSELARRGRRVMTIKHGHHPADVDRKGSDSWRHFHEGRAERVLLATPGLRVLFASGYSLTWGGGTGQIGGSSDTLKFFGGTGSTKPSITGSRGGNAALADLLTKLATLGLITDSTTA